VQVRAVASGQIQTSIPGRVQKAVFSPDERYVATLNDEPVARLYELDTGRLVMTCQGHRSIVMAIAFAPDGQRAATAGMDGVVKIWSARPGRELMSAETPLFATALSRDGHWAAVPPLDGTCQIWDTERGVRTRTLAPDFQYVDSAAFSPDNRYLATSGTDRQVRIWELASGREIRSWLAHRRTVSGLEYSPDGHAIATGCFDGTAALWEADTGRLLRRFQGHSNLLYRATFSPDGRSLATASYDQTARVWDTRSGQCRFMVPTGFADVPEVQFSPDGRRLATVANGMIQLWDARNGEPLGTWPARQGIKGLCFSPDGQRLVVISSEMGSGWSDLPGLEVWDANRGQPLLRLRGHNACCGIAAFAADGRRLLTGSLDQTARLWETFPWRESEYPGPSNLPLSHRVQQYAEAYWRERLAAERRIEPASIAVEPPLRPRPARTLWPPRDPSLKPEQLDLTEHYTGLMTCLFHPTVADLVFDDTLEGVPSGAVALGGVRFDVRGVVLLRRRVPSWQFIDRLYERYPKAIEGLRVGRPFRRLHVIHAVLQNQVLSDKKAILERGTRVGSYRLHYVDESQIELPIVFGVDAGDWWHFPQASEPAPSSAMVVWSGANASSELYGATLRLYLRTYDNPHPELEVSLLDLVSELTLGAPFVIAMTVE